MGLLSKLATLPLAPVYGVVWVGKRLADYAEEELYGEAAISRALLEVEVANDAGEISDEEREEREGRLLELLRQRGGSLGGGA